MDGWCPDRCKGITESEELENAGAGQERMETSLGRPRLDLGCSAIGERERESEREKPMTISMKQSISREANHRLANQKSQSFYGI
jgi:hypothetical protein